MKKTLFLLALLASALAHAGETVVVDDRPLWKRAMDSVKQTFDKLGAKFDANTGSDNAKRAAEVAAIQDAKNAPQLIPDDEVNGLVAKGYRLCSHADVYDGFTNDGAPCRAMMWKLPPHSFKYIMLNAKTANPPPVVSTVHGILACRSEQVAKAKGECGRKGDLLRGIDYRFVAWEPL